MRHLAPPMTLLVLAACAAHPPAEPVLPVPQPASVAPLAVAPTPLGAPATPTPSARVAELVFAPLTDEMWGAITLQALDRLNGGYQEAAPALLTGPFTVSR